jgi:hypothetical protein
MMSTDDKDSLTTDIIARLRAIDISWSNEGELCAWAADEIERLRTENERLREALNEIIIFSDDHDCAVKIARAALEEKKS